MRKKYGIIGKELKSSLSPKLYEFIFNRYNINAIYDIIEIENRNQFKKLVKAILNRYNGLNITYPFKKEIIYYLDRLDKSVIESPNCNLVVKTDKNELIGYNTDLYGIEKAYISDILKFLKEDYKYHIADILILGSGSTAENFLSVLNKYNVFKMCDVFIYSRNNNTARKLRNKFNRLYIINDIDQLSGLNVLCVINTTPVNPLNIVPHNSLLNNSVKLIIDVNYNKYEIRQFYTSNIKYLDGKSFLIHQFIKNIKILFDIDLETNNSIVGELFRLIE